MNEEDRKKLEEIEAIIRRYNIFLEGERQDIDFESEVKWLISKLREAEQLIVRMNQIGQAEQERHQHQLDAISEVLNDNNQQRISKLEADLTLERSKREDASAIGDEWIRQLEADLAACRERERRLAAMLNIDVVRPSTLVGTAPVICEGCGGEVNPDYGKCRRCD